MKEFRQSMNAMLSVLKSIKQGRKEQYTHKASLGVSSDEQLLDIMKGIMITHEWFEFQDKLFWERYKKPLSYDIWVKLGQLTRCRMEATCTYRILLEAHAKGESEGWNSQEIYNFFTRDLYEFLVDFDTAWVFSFYKLYVQRGGTDKAVLAGALGALAVEKHPDLRDQDNMLELPSEAVIVSESVFAAQDLESFRIALFDAPGKMLYQVYKQRASIADFWQKSRRNRGLLPLRPLDDTVDIADTHDAIREIDERMMMKQYIDKSVSAKNERELLHLMHRYPDLTEHGGSIDLAAITGRSPAQIRVEKKRAFDAMREHLQRPEK